MQKPSLIISFKNAFKGLLVITMTERNFQLELFAFCINIFLIFYLRLTKIDAILIFIICILVLIFEIFNTAIEKICDFIQPNYDKKIGFIKDICAGAVTLMAFCSVIVGIIIYWKYIF